MKMKARGDVESLLLFHTELDRTTTGKGRVASQKMLIRALQLLGMRKARTLHSGIQTMNIQAHLAPFSDSYENAAMWRNREDWRKVSRVLDRLGLILTFLFVVALCLFLFIGIRA